MPRRTIEYQQGHGFDMSTNSLIGMKLLRDHLTALQKEFDFVQGLGFYGSRTKGRAREFNPEQPDKLGSDFDLCLFYDGADFQGNNGDFETNIQAKVIKFISSRVPNIKQGEGSTVIIDISRKATNESLNEFITSVRQDTDPFSLNNRKLLARFFLGVGDGLYENRTYILNELSKQDNGDNLLNILMQRLHGFERIRNDDPDHPNQNPIPYSGYPKTIAEAKKYFITL